MATGPPTKRRKVARASDGENNWKSTNLNPMLIDNVLDVLFDYLPLSGLKNSREVCKLWNSKIIEKMSSANPCKLNLKKYGKVKRFLSTYTGCPHKSIYKAVDTIDIRSTEGILKIMNNSFLNEDSKHRNLRFTFDDVYEEYERIQVGDFISVLVSISGQLKSLEFHGDRNYSVFEDYFKMTEEEQQEGITWPEFDLNRLETLKLTVHCKKLGKFQFLQNLTRNVPPKLQNLVLSYRKFPGVESPKNALILPLASQLSKLSIEVKYQRELGLASALFNLSVNGLRLKSLLLDVNYGITDNLIQAQEIQTLGNFLGSQKSTLEVLKLHLIDDKHYGPPAGFMDEINVPVFANVTNLKLFERTDDDVLPSAEFYVKFMTPRIILSEKFPKLTKFSVDSRNFERILTSGTSPVSLVKHLKWTFTKKGKLPQNLRHFFPDIEELVINYPPNPESLYFLHPQFNGQQIPWKETLKKLTIHYPAYDLENFDFESLSCLTALEHLKFISIPAEMRKEKDIVPEFEQYLAKSNLTTITFENYRIRTEQVQLLRENNPRFIYIGEKVKPFDLNDYLNFDNF